MNTAADKNYHRSSRKAGFFFLLAMLIALVSFMSMVLLTKAGPSAEKVSRKKYMSYEVQAGDTLWDLASEYNDFSRQDSGTYVEEVRSMNHLYGDQIHAGAYIVLPYYE